MHTNEIQEIAHRMRKRAEGYKGGGVLMVSTGWDKAFEDILRMCEILKELDERIVALERRKGG